MTTLPLSIPPVAATSLPPLSPEHLAQFQQAQQRSKKIRRAVSVAAIDAWFTAIFAALTLLTGLFSLTGLLMGVGLALIAYNSFRGHALLKQFDLRGPRLLAVNQLVLMILLIAYAAAAILAARHSSILSSSLGSDPIVAAQLGSMMGSIDHLVWLISLAVYGGLILGTILAQGLTALYYASRKKLLTAYQAQTPDWIIQLQKIQSA